MRKRVDVRTRQPSRLGDLGSVEGTAVKTSGDEAGEGSSRRRLVEHLLVDDDALLPVEVSAKPIGGGRQAFAVEAEHRCIPAHQLRRVQVPALVDTALERSADQALVQGP